MNTPTLLGNNRKKIGWLMMMGLDMWMMDEKYLMTILMMSHQLNVKKLTAKPKTINKMLLAASAKAKKAKTEVTSIGEDDLLNDLLKEVEQPRPAPVKFSKGKPQVFRTPTSALPTGSTPRRLQQSSGPRQNIFKVEPRSPPKPRHTKNLPAKGKTVVKCEPSEREEGRYSSMVGDPSRVTKEESYEAAMDMDSGMDGQHEE